jgi:hypothetical protein
MVLATTDRDFERIFGDPETVDRPLRQQGWDMQELNLLH